MTTKKNHIPPAMWEAAGKMLSGRRVVPVTEFDTEIAKLAESVPEIETTGAGRNRRKNLCDHIKANWTKAGLTQHAVINGTEYIIWLPSVGAIRGVNLVEHAHVVALLRAVLRIADGRTVAATNGPAPEGTRTDQYPPGRGAGTVPPGGGLDAPEAGDPALGTAL